MKTLVVVGHPHLEKSEVTMAWMTGLHALEGEDLKIHLLSTSVGRDYTFNVKAEQSLLRDADRVILQFPLYWLSIPGLMKCWIDQVWDGRRSAGGTGTLEGKVVDIAFSAGVPDESFLMEGGCEAMFKPLTTSLNFAGAKLGRIFAFYGAGADDAPARLKESVEAYKDFCGE